MHRGLLPFRVWQLFDAMVEFASNNEPDKFVCAAGVLTHYLGIYASRFTYRTCTMVIQSGL